MIVRTPCVQFLRCRSRTIVLVPWRSKQLDSAWEREGAPAVGRRAAATARPSGEAATLAHDVQVQPEVGRGRSPCGGTSGVSSKRQNWNQPPSVAASASGAMTPRTDSCRGCVVRVLSCTRRPVADAPDYMSCAHATSARQTGVKGFHASSNTLCNAYGGRRRVLVIVNVICAGVGVWCALPLLWWEFGVHCTTGCPFT